MGDQFGYPPWTSEDSQSPNQRKVMISFGSRRKWANVSQKTGNSAVYIQSILKPDLLTMERSLSLHLWRPAILISAWDLIIILLNH